MMARKSYRIWFVVLALAGATIDQATKYGIFAWLYQHPTRYSNDSGSCQVIPGAFELLAQFTDEPAGEFKLRNASSDRMPRVNRGALFGWLNEHEGLANRIFAMISVVAGIAIIGW